MNLCEILGAPLCDVVGHTGFAVVRGWQLYAAGLNSSGLMCPKNGSIGANCSPTAQQIKHTEAVMDKVIASAPLQPWSCS